MKPSYNILVYIRHTRKKARTPQLWLAKARDLEALGLQ
jgi:hypothetical protein